MNQASRLDSNFTTARELKEQGNAFVAQQEYQKALGKYTKIFAYINGLTDQPPMATLLAEQSSDIHQQKLNSTQTAEVGELRLAANLNISLCYLKLKQPEKAIKFASEALVTNPKNVKALVRRGQAYLDVGDVDGASKDLDVAFELAPSDASIRQARVILKGKLKEVAQKEREQFKGMFERVKKQDTLEST